MGFQWARSHAYLSLCNFVAYYGGGVLISGFPASFCSFVLLVFACRCAANSLHLFVAARLDRYTCMPLRGLLDSALQCFSRKLRSRALSKRAGCALLRSPQRWPVASCTDIPDKASGRTLTLSLLLCLWWFSRQFMRFCGVGVYLPLRGLVASLVCRCAASSLDSALQCFFRKLRSRPLSKKAGCALLRSAQKWPRASCTDIPDKASGRTLTLS